MAQKVDGFQGVNFVSISLSGAYGFVASPKEWTKYRGVFFTFIAVLQCFDPRLKLFAVA